MKDDPEAVASSARRPLRRDAERNRFLIIETARAVFAKHGLDASLDEIAREAGLGVGTVYRRFPNREALIDALLADTTSTMKCAVDEAAAMPRAWDGLHQFMVRVVELQMHDKGLRDAMVFRHLAESERPMVRDVVKPAIHGLVERAQQQGDLRADLTPADIVVLVIAGLGAAEFTAPAGPDAWRRYLEIVMNGMRARPAGADDALSCPPLDDDQVETCMAGWRYGSHEPPRSSPLVT